MKLLAEKTSLECVLWSGLQIIFYVKHKTGNEFSYIVKYDVNKHSCIRYSVEFLTDTVEFETITEVLRFITSYDENSIQSIEIEITN